MLSLEKLFSMASSAKSESRKRYVRGLLSYKVRSERPGQIELYRACMRKFYLLTKKYY